MLHDSTHMICPELTHLQTLMVHGWLPGAKEEGEVVSCDEEALGLDSNDGCTILWTQ